MRATGLKLTAFTVFTILITFYLASIIGRLNPFEDVYSVQAEFNDATGILKGDPVTVAGVTVGKVSGLEVDGANAVLTLQINGTVELPSTTIADIHYRNLLGQRVVNLLEPEEQSDDVLEDGDLIPLAQTRPALDLSAVFNNLRPLIQSTNPEDINTVARAVLRVFKGREDDFAQVLGNIGRLTKTLAARDQRFSRLVSDLRDVADIVNAQSGSIRTALNRFTAFMESLAEMTPTVESVVDRLETASRKFGSLVARNRSNLDQDLRDLNVVLGVVHDNLGPLARVAKNLKEILLATARSQSYGKWWNLYVVTLCPENPTEQCTPLIGP